MTNVDISGKAGCGQLPSPWGAARRRLPQAQGFTLIEVMVVVAIVGLLLTTAIPGMINLVRESRLSAQADLLVATLNSARVEAIRRRANVTVCPATADPNSDTACSSSASNWVKGFLVHDGTAIIQRVQPKTDLALTSASTGVTFAATLGTTTATSFTLCISGAKQQQVSVTSTGRVSRQLTSTACS